MKYLASSESTVDAGGAVSTARRALHPVLVQDIEASTLSRIDGTLIYVPIVMPVDMHDKYKERSRFVTRKRSYECCPHLKYEIFLHGKLEDTFDEYLRGLALAAPHLQRLGASEAQCEEFLTILNSARERAMTERRDMTRQ